MSEKPPTALMQKASRIPLWCYILGSLLIIILTVILNNHIIEKGKREFIAHIKIPVIAKIDFRETPLDEAVQEIHSKLSQLDPYFETCEFRLDDCFLDFRDAKEFQITLTLNDKSALAAIKYTSTLMQGTYIIRPNGIIFAPLHCDCDHRSITERMSSPIINFFTTQQSNAKEIFTK